VSDPTACDRWTPTRRRSVIRCGHRIDHPATAAVVGQLSDRSKQAFGDTTPPARVATPANDRPDADSSRSPSGRAAAAALPEP